MVWIANTVCCEGLVSRYRNNNRSSRRSTILYGFALLVVTHCIPVAASDGDLLIERVRFMNADRLLRKDMETEFLAELEQLKNYPLYHYLRYRWLSHSIGRNSDGIDTAVLDFVETYSWSHLASQLVGKWQRQLHKQERWREFINVSRHPKAREYPCRLIEAEVRAGDTAARHDLLSDVWLNQPLNTSACNRTATLVLESVQPAAGLIWRRISRAMEIGHWRTARKMGDFLGSRDKALLELWVDSYRNPGDNADNPALLSDNDFNRRVVIQQHLRWARFATAAADEHWQQVRLRYSFSPEERYKVDRQIAIHTAQLHLPQAASRLQALQRTDETVQQWQLRVALRAGDWKGALAQIGSLPDSDLDDPQWRYWRARALEQLGRRDQSQPIYRQLSVEANYYGFLAADRLGVDYSISESMLPIDPKQKQVLTSTDDVVRAREYFFTGLRVDARRVWERLIKDADATRLTVLAQLAHEWGWHDRAIYTVGKTDHKRHYRLRFPTPYTDKVIAVAKREAVDPAWIYGLIRRESAFISDIRSPAGAVGLMQLLPSTAKYVAGKMGRKVSNGDLTDGSVSISLGAHYLRRLLDRYDNQVVVATAAYNAGPNRVAKWLPGDGRIPADIWIDTLPLSETRNYVRAVMAYATIYSWRMNQSVVPLEKRVQAVASVQ